MEVFEKLKEEMENLSYVEINRLACPFNMCIQNFNCMNYKVINIQIQDLSSNYTYHINIKKIDVKNEKQMDMIIEGRFLIENFEVTKRCYESMEEPNLLKLLSWSCRTLQYELSERFKWFLSKSEYSEDDYQKSLELIFPDEDYEKPSCGPDCC